MPVEATSAMQTQVRFWYTQLGEREGAAVCAAIADDHVSQGALTAEFERRLAQYLGVPYVVLTTSGSVALYLAYVSLGVGHGDEIIVPNRTFIATAHAGLMAGAKVKLVDCQSYSTIIDVTKIESAITSRTKVIVPVHLNGNAADMNAISVIASKHGLAVVEDSAQAFGSKIGNAYLGTLGDIGCYSLGILKMLTTGQGGFLATRNQGLYEKLLILRNHGVSNNFWASYDTFGFNFKYNDILAAIGLTQLDKIGEKIQRHIDVFQWYEKSIANVPFIRLLPSNVVNGNVPLWVEALCSERDRVVDELSTRGIQLRPLLRDLSQSAHLENDDAHFVNSKVFARLGVALPCGPDISIEARETTVKALRSLRDRVKTIDP